MPGLVLSRPRVPQQTRSASEMDYRLPVDRIHSRRDKGLPGSRAVLFVRAVVQHPAGRTAPSPGPLFEEIHGDGAIAFTENRTLGIRNEIVFEATYPRLTRSRAYASPIPFPRPSQGSLPARAGSPLTGRVSHPLDDERNFMESSQVLQSQSTSRAWSHCLP
jgi:hypothetical protein